MENAYPKWLTEQMVSGVRGFNLCAYLVALEGWRRGLTLRWYYDSPSFLKPIGFEPVGKTFSLSSDDHTHFFFRSRGDAVSNKAVDIATNKHQTKRYLNESHVSAPVGFDFNIDDDQQKVLHSAVQTGFPLVLKPVYGSLGKGVVTNIQSEQELKDAIDFVRSEHNYKAYIVEQWIKGDDYRVYVIENEIAGAFKRFPANITGDGTSTIEYLITQKNEERKTNPHFRTRLIKINQETNNMLARHGLSLKDIPKKGETVYLNNKSNISSGGDSMDVTHQLDSHIRKIAIEALKAIPGLKHGGVDIIANDHEAVVIEINVTAGISSHLFPLYGEPVNVPASIVDYYFPETKGVGANSTKIYYDHKNVLKLLREKSINHIEIADAPVGQLYAKRYVISGKVQGVGFRNWIRKQARQRGLSGYTRNLNNGKVVVVVGGVDQDAVDEFKSVCLKGPNKAEVTEIKEYTWDKQIKVGFEIRRRKA